MTILFAVGLFASLAAAGWLATEGHGIWAVPLIVVAAGCGRFLVRSVSRKRFAVADVPPPEAIVRDDDRQA